MEELIEKVDKLKQELNNDHRIIKIQELNEQIKNNKILYNKTIKYKETLDDELKKEITDNKLYRDYKHAETELNILILEINQKLKEISKKGQCQ
ncbi:MAG: hypothetical protein IJI22_03790 [Bacilli bacterium]|nr:hypothetical protein [Bacilli bacterium]